MQNSLFYSQGNSKSRSNKKDTLDFHRKKENTLASLNEVENFLFNYRNSIKYVKLYNWFRKY